MSVTGIQRADHDASGQVVVWRSDDPHPRQQGGPKVNWLWEILRYVAAWGGTGLIIWFWYWMFSNIGTF
jgi:hypothetical protein